MDEATWLALTVTLTVVGVLGTWLAFRRGGLSAGLLGAAVTLLFPAAYLTKTLEMLTRIVSAVADWATSLILSPTVWIGVVLAGMSVLLFGASRALAGRGGAGSAEDATGSTPGRAPEAPRRREVGRGRPPKQEPVVDDDLADIEALLRKRGIS